MTQQQPFTSHQPGQHMDRFEKMEFLRETCTEQMIDKTLPEELLMFMSDEYFAQFYEHFCSCYDLCRDAQELARQRESQN